MSLVPYTATALSRNDITDTPKDKNVVSGAIVEVKDSLGALVVIYDDEIGTNPETQKTCDADGQRTFYVEAGDYILEIDGKAQFITTGAKVKSVKDNLEAIKALLKAQGLSGDFGFFADGFTYVNAGDVGIYTDGKIYTYAGASALPVAVTAGTNPDSDGDYKLVKTNPKNTVTSAELTSFSATIGDSVSVSDRDGAVFTKVSGMIANGIDILAADDGNQWLLFIDSSSSVSLRAMGYKFGDDATPLVIRAASINVKELTLPKGDVLFSELELTGSFSGMKIKGVGSGLAYAPSTTIKALNNPQVDIFVSRAGVGGVDNVKFEGFKLEGLDAAYYGVRQLSGAGWEFRDIQTDNFNEWAIYSEQGLNYYNRMFIRSNKDTGTGGLAVYSDAFVDNIECTGGGVGLWLMAGGNRVSNVLSNSQSENCILLKPLDGNTNHINTALSNIYVGEVYNETIGKAIIKIEGNSTRRVTDVQFSNLHTVSAASSGVKHNIHCDISKADRVTFNGWQALGIDAFETADLYDEGGLLVEDSTEIKLSSGCMYGISKNPVKIINSSVQVADGFGFKNWGGAFASGRQLAAISCEDSTSRVGVGDVEFINLRVNATKAISATDGNRFSLGKMRAGMAGTTPATMVEFDANDPTYSACRTTSGVEEFFGSRVSAKGQFSSVAGGGATSAFSIPTISQNACYDITIQQVGNGANGTSGKVFSSGASTGIVTTGNTNSVESLKNIFSVSGTAVSVNIGSGYGPTTWEYQITRLL